MVHLRCSDNAPLASSAAPGPLNHPSIHAASTPLSFFDHIPVAHTARRSFVLAPAHRRGLQCDIGSNINVTADRSILRDYILLPAPFDLHGADASVRSMICIGHGMFRLHFLTNNTHSDIRMYHCPQLSETLLSPQAICDDNRHLFRGFTIHCSDLGHPESPINRVQDIFKHKTCNLYLYQRHKLINISRTPIRGWLASGETWQAIFLTFLNIS